MTGPQPLARPLAGGQPPTAPTPPTFGSVAKVALAGDSHHGSLAVVGSLNNIADTRGGLMAYGRDFLTLVPPSTWDRPTHGIGGSTVALFIDGHTSTATGGVEVSQLDELIDQVTAEEIDTVILSIGQNDFWTLDDEAPNGPIFDLAVSMDRLEDEIVTVLVTLGANIVLVCVPPQEDILVPPVGTPITNAETWNRELHRRFGNMDGVKVLDLSNFYGRPDQPYRIAERYLSDGSHYSAMGQFSAGRAYAQILEPYADEIMPAATTWVTANPYFIAGETAQPLIYPNTVDANTVAFAARTGGEAGERICIPSFTNTYAQCGASTPDEKTVRWVVSPAALAAGICVTGNIVPDASLDAILIRHHVFGLYHHIRIFVPGAAGYPIVTAAEVIAAINSDATAGALVTASPGPTFTGTGVSYHGAFNCGYQNMVPIIVSQQFGLDDAATPADGALIRATVELEPYPNEPFNLGLCGLSLRRQFTLINYDFLADVIGERPLLPPLPGRRIKLVTPWIAKETGWEKFMAWLTYSGIGRFHVYRLGVETPVVT